MKRKQLNVMRRVAISQAVDGKTVASRALAREALRYIDDELDRKSAKREARRAVTERVRVDRGSDRRGEEARGFIGRRGKLEMPPSGDRFITSDDFTGKDRRKIYGGRRAKRVDRRLGF